MKAQKKVLIIRLSSMGDVIFNLPLANVLKKAGYYVAWVVGEKGVDIVKNNSAVDETIFVPLKLWKGQNFFKKIRERYKIVKYIRSQNFDIAIDTQGLLKSGFWCLISGAKRRITSWAAREFSALVGNEIIPSIVNDNNTHATINYLKFAKHLGVNHEEIEASLPPLTQEIKDKIDGLLKDVDKSKPLVAIAPATTWVPKHWNKDHWKDLISLLENDYTLVFTGTNSDKELIEYISEKKHLSIAGQTSVLELGEFFSRCDLVISLDSGSTHLAWASKNPKIISIFCCTPPKRYAPLGGEDKYIALSGALSCQPCHKRVCPLKIPNKCTLTPHVKDVVDAVYKLLPPEKGN